ncbi:iron-sulfur cluster assembly scaffold protein [Paracoccaceae bacterium Fryx2]|nr:iron-sulfur cluster assembly scaffold protein [Paracoccaceae bacterium Fryx2]
MWGYSEQVRDHFFNPRNVGSLADANAVGEAGSLHGGDALRLMLRVNPETQVIEAARFQGIGGGPAIAVASALTELVQGKSVDEARRLTGHDIAQALGGLPSDRMASPETGRRALGAALAAFTGEPEPVIAAVPLTVSPRQSFVPIAPTHPSNPKVARDVPLSAAEELAEVTRILEQMRAVFRADGGDVELMEFSGNRVQVHLTGACKGCQMASLTLGGLQKRIADALGRPIRVIPVAKS